MDHASHDLDLATRLSALEGRVPIPAEPPVLPVAARRRRFALSMAVAPALALALAVTAGVGAAVTHFAEGNPNIQNPGQPLEGAGLECMSPPEAAAFLSQRGYTRIDWQVETGSVLTPDGRKGSSSTTHVTDPPAHGYVIPGSVHDDGRLVMTVDQRVGATGIGACFGEPMP
jgi:hypothetical protein